MTETRDLHPLERLLLEYLSGCGEASDGEIISSGRLPDEGSYRRAAQWLLSRGLVEEASCSSESFVELAPLGEESARAGATPEILARRLVESGVGDVSAIQADPRFDPSRWGSAVGALIRCGAVTRSGAGLEPSPAGSDLYERTWDLVYAPLAAGARVPLQALPPDVRELVIQRSPRRGKGRAEFAVVEISSRRMRITPAGAEALASAGRPAVGQLTADMLADGSWRQARFRRYDLDMPPSRLHTGRLHPYRVFLDAVRRKFVSMGFLEMRGSFAESEFWNNDALFMPQFHPARDIHDVYFLEGGRVEEPPAGILDRVARTHEDGWQTGGRGWQYVFDRGQAARAILRSQGTALSARCLASGPSVPGKYFAVARCFRYDQVDATHLPDFFQVEGIVLGRGIDMRHLLGLLRLFAVEIAGAREHRFAPAYFPFTEPSVELHVKHPALGWFELGGAGLFRPEVTLPLGVDVPVIAWGLGLDRMAMVAMGLDDIRDLQTPDLARLRRMSVLPDRVLGGGRRGDAQD